MIFEQKVSLKGEYNTPMSNFTNRRSVEKVNTNTPIPDFTNRK